MELLSPAWKVNLLPIPSSAAIRERAFEALVPPESENFFREACALQAPITNFLRTKRVCRRASRDLTLFVIAVAVKRWEYREEFRVYIIFSGVFDAAMALSAPNNIPLSCPFHQRYCGHGID